MEKQTTQNSNKIELVYIIKELIEEKGTRINRGELPLAIKGINPLFFGLPESALFKLGFPEVVALNKVYKKVSDTAEIMYTDENDLSRYNGCPIRRLTYVFERDLQEQERIKRDSLESKFYQQLKEIKTNGGKNE